MIRSSRTTLLPFTVLLCAGQLFAQATEKDTVTVQSDLYRTDAGRASPSVSVRGRPAPAPPLRVIAGGGNVLARWRHARSQTSDVQLHVYYDRTHRKRSELRPRPEYAGHRPAAPVRPGAAARRDLGLRLPFHRQPQSGPRRVCRGSADVARPAGQRVRAGSDRDRAGAAGDDRHQGRPQRLQRHGGPAQPTRRCGI